MNCQVYGCLGEAPREIVMHILYKGKTHHFRMCRSHHKLLLQFQGMWHIWRIKNGTIQIKIRELIAT